MNNDYNKGFLFEKENYITYWLGGVIVRKTAAFFLGFYLLIISSIANSEVETIKFLGIDWYSSPEEFEIGLSNKGLDYYIYNISSSDHWFRFDGIPFEPPYSYDMEVSSKTYSYYSSKSKEHHYEPLTNVAGYGVSYISASFLASYSLETMSIGSPSWLARAEYKIWDHTFPNGITIDDAYDDLKEKLSAIYGEPNGYKEKEPFSISRRTTWWYAKDGTGVSLRLETLSSNSIAIEYGIANEKDYLNDIYTIRQYEKQKTIETLSENLEGL